MTEMRIKRYTLNRECEVEVRNECVTSGWNVMVMFESWRVLNNHSCFMCDCRYELYSALQLFGKHNIIPTTLHSYFTI